VGAVCAKTLLQNVTAMKQPMVMGLVKMFMQLDYKIG
jgi:hypothetical protein